MTFYLSLSPNLNFFSHAKLSQIGPSLPYSQSIVNLVENLSWAEDRLYQECLPSVVKVPPCSLKKCPCFFKISKGIKQKFKIRKEFIRTFWTQSSNWKIAMKINIFLATGNWFLCRKWVVPFFILILQTTNLIQKERSLAVLQIAIPKREEFHLGIGGQAVAMSVQQGLSRL